MESIRICEFAWGKDFTEVAQDRRHFFHDGKSRRSDIYFVFKVRVGFYHAVGIAFVREGQALC